MSSHSGTKRVSWGFEDSNRSRPSSPGRSVSTCSLGVGHLPRSLVKDSLNSAPSAWLLGTAFVAAWVYKIIAYKEVLG